MLSIATNIAVLLMTALCSRVIFNTHSRADHPTKNINQAWFSLCSEVVILTGGGWRVVLGILGALGAGRGGVAHSPQLGREGPPPAARPANRPQQTHQLRRLAPIKRSLALAAWRPLLAHVGQHLADVGGQQVIHFVALLWGNKGNQSTNQHFLLSLNLNALHPLTSDVSHRSLLPWTRFPIVMWKYVFPLLQLEILVKGYVVKISCGWRREIQTSLHTGIHWKHAPKSPDAQGNNAPVIIASLLLYMNVYCSLRFIFITTKKWITRLP